MRQQVRRLRLRPTRDENSEIIRTADHPQFSALLSKFTILHSLRLDEAFLGPDHLKAIESLIELRRLKLWWCIIEDEGAIPVSSTPFPHLQIVQTYLVRGSQEWLRAVLSSSPITHLQAQPNTFPPPDTWPLLPHARQVVLMKDFVHVGFGSDHSVLHSIPQVQSLCLTALEVGWSPRIAKLPSLRSLLFKQKIVIQLLRENTAEEVVLEGGLLRSRTEWFSFIDELAAAGARTIKRLWLKDAGTVTINDTSYVVPRVVSAFPGLEGVSITVNLSEVRSHDTVDSTPFNSDASLSPRCSAPPVHWQPYPRCERYRCTL